MHGLALAVLLCLHSSALSDQEFNVVGPLSPHFQQWLSKNGYDDEDFMRATQGSYGGKTDDDQKIIKTPVIFIYDNSDAALLQGIDQNDVIGWKNLIECLLKKGYTSAELYVLSWGDTTTGQATERTNDCATTLRLRKFLEAVIAYTGAEQVSLVTYSMEETLGRKIIKGGKIQANDGDCDAGVPLRNVDVFVGLTAANNGLCNSEGADSVEPTHNEQAMNAHMKTKELIFDDNYDWVNIWSI